MVGAGVLDCAAVRVLLPVGAGESGDPQPARSSVPTSESAAAGEREHRGVVQAGPAIANLLLAGGGD